MSFQTLLGISGSTVRFETTAVDPPVGTSELFSTQPMLAILSRHFCSIRRLTTQPFRQLIHGLSHRVAIYQNDTFAKAARRDRSSSPDISSVCSRATRFSDTLKQQHPHRFLSSSEVRRAIAIRASLSTYGKLSVSPALAQTGPALSINVSWQSRVPAEVAASLPARETPAVTDGHFPGATERSNYGASLFAPSF